MYILGNFVFPLFQSLPYITTFKNNGKIKINWDIKLTTTYIYIYIYIYIYLRIYAEVYRV